MSSSRISAILGPTNTGKTFVAIERMLSHTSGMIGFPLRLLARENYDKVAAIKGKAQVALITGEEQIVPDNPRYFICTVEAMPLDKMVEFICVDEIQLAADLDRGHIFTDRILHARGLSETMFIGSDTIHHLLQRMVPGITITSRPRFSQLSYTGYKKIIRLPQRSAVVAFSAADVYALAEFMRRQKGGTAVVMGALSPRARNAQVGMYQAGEVDYIVATDAIGMGLNMDIDHVAFSTTRKYDGRNMRALRAAEMGQIAGRAGRYQRNGTFGTTADEGSLDNHLAKKIEGHHFDPIQFVSWRNSDLNFDTIKDLRFTLNKPAPRDFFKRPTGLEDQEILDVMAQDSSIDHLAQGYEAVKMLWDVCQVPDYRRLLTEIHARFLMQLYRHLQTGHGKIPADFIQQQVVKLDRYDGDMDAIMTRLAHIRMWTYISNRGQWIDDAKEWQEKTRSIEDRLSDALHLELTQRFVDKRVAVLMKKLDDNAEFTASVSPSGDVLVEGQFVGKLAALRFHADQEVLSSVAKGIKVAARKAIIATLPVQVEKLAQENPKDLTLARNNEILWHGKPIAKLQTGKTILTPNIQLLCEEEMEQPQRQKSIAVIEEWLKSYLHEQLSDLFTLQNLVADSQGALRGMVYQLIENLGCLPIAQLKTSIADVNAHDRQILADAGLMVGDYAAYVKNLYAPRHTILRSQLWSVFHGRQTASAQLAGKLVLQTEEKISDAESWAVGYWKTNQIFLRADKFERLAKLFTEHLKLHKAVKIDHVKPTVPLNLHQIMQLADAMGFVAKKIEKAVILQGRKKSTQKVKPKSTKADPNSPFADLVDKVAKK